MSDLISRQAALNMMLEQLHYDDFDKAVVDYEIAIKELKDLPSVQPEIIRCKDCKHNPKITWFGCPLAHCSETQRPETAWCWKAERREE